MRIFEPAVEQCFTDLENKIISSGMSADMGRIRSAFEVAAGSHETQKRKDGSPYVTHTVAAASICIDMGLDEDSIISALLHDTIEDVKEYTNPNLTVDGLLLVKYAGRTNLAKGITESLPEYAKMFGTRVYETKIRESIATREAQVTQKSLIAWARTSTTSQDYFAFVDEFLGL